MSADSRTTVLEVSGVQWASQRAVAEAVLSRRPGVTAVDVNPVAQTATVTYDPHLHISGRAGRLGARLWLPLRGTSRPAPHLRSLGGATCCRRAASCPRRSR